MAYTPKTDWQLNDVVQPEDINRIEKGIDDAHKEKLGTNQNAVSATKLLTGRTITLTGGVSGVSELFDGSKNISITITSVDGTKVTGTLSVDTTGNAGTATKLKASRKIALKGAATAAGVNFDGSTDIEIEVTSIDATKLSGTASVNTTGNAGSATKLQNKRTIALSGGVTGTATEFDGSGNITIPVTAVNPVNLSGAVPVNKGGTGVTNLNVNKLKTDTNSDTFLQVFLSPDGNDSSNGLSESTPMKSIRAAVGKYGGLNRLQLRLAAGTYTDASTVNISGNTYVEIMGIPTTPGSVVISHPIIFQSTDAKLNQVTFDLNNSNETYPGVTLRQSKYDIQNCVFKGKLSVHAGINVSLGSSGYIWKCTFQSGIRGGEIGSGASMTAIECSIGSSYAVGFDVNGGLLLSNRNTNNAATRFTMYNSALIINDGVLLNPVASN